MVPPQLFRAYSMSGSRSTKGFCANTIFQPPTDRHQHRDCRDSIYDMNQGEITVMLGHHLAWHDRNDDDLTSFTNSFLFAVEHALGSRNKQFDCHIAVIDTAKAMTVPTRTSAGGQPIHIHPALTVYVEAKVGAYAFWGNRDGGRLHPRKFTHEFVTVGVVKYTEIYHHISMNDLIKKGLFKIYPEFDIPEGFKTTGLYTRLIALREALYCSSKLKSKVIPADVECAQTTSDSLEGDLGNTEWAEVSLTVGFQENATDPVPEQDLEFAVDVSKSMAILQPGECLDDVKAPLNLVLAILSLRLRERGSPRLINYIRVNYERQDLESLIFPNISHVADNLPEQIQYLDLIRDACDALSVEMIPDNILSYGIGIAGHEKFLEEDERLKRKRSHNLWKKKVDKPKKRKKEQTSDEQQLKRQKSDLATPDRAVRSSELEIEQVVQDEATNEMAKTPTSEHDAAELIDKASEGNNENT
ncbi:hypothetical protein BU16DRAFT_619643 [Lophium mytilinum]|uniref:DUF7587 domain-containing protein n=1 Tax=Lophium mytilinum TaxID=390894 RepID=A0A6A6QMF3_9PEZI|nr:hypothetical protein BU16DRAFT_619643 [Lophium mytilinum]